MRIAIIGGHDRTETKMAEVARRCGHRLEFHTGHVGGRGADEIRAMVARADLVVILTDINSHGGVKVGRQAAQRQGTEVLLTKRFGLKQLERILCSPPIPLAS
jgi:hypothetical protein